MLMMFMSGIFFSADAMPETARAAFGLNPMVGLIEAYRDVLMHNQWPVWADLGYTIVVSLPMLAVAVFVLLRYERHYPKLIY
jgi:lipopolysaccharide transport system permease protein